MRVWSPHPASCHVSSSTRIVDQHVCVRFSVAHELGHFLFSDHAAQMRYRTESHAEHARPDDWQIEVLCNVAAAEDTMPAGAFPAAYADDLSLPHLLDLRAEFGVSTEALLRRVVKLTERAVCLFAATRLPEGGFRVDYTVPSHAFEHRLPAGQTIGSHRARALHGRRLLCRRHRGVARDRRRCPSRGRRHPTLPWAPLSTRGRAASTRGRSRSTGPGHPYRARRRNAARARGSHDIAHIVNDTAQRWADMASASALGRRLRAAREDYAAWATDAEHRQLGAVRFCEVEPDLWIASMVAQAGYGPSRRPRLRLPALRDCLKVLAGEAQLAAPPSTCLPSAPARGPRPGRECAT